MKEGEVTYCETMAAYRWHIRHLGAGEEPNYGGYTGLQPTTLCGLKSSWDLRPPVDEPSLDSDGVCSTCKERL